MKHQSHRLVIAVKQVLFRTCTQIKLATILGALSCSVLAAPADDIRDAQRLYQEGKFSAALERVDIALKAIPKDAQGRFLRALIYTEQKKSADAIRELTGLTEDYPELPEPYNNLAVLYASQGKLDKAKAALEVAIHAHPSYGTAHENLGDVYAQLASRAYDRALALDKSNAAAQSKLELVKELFSAGATKADRAKTAPLNEPEKNSPLTSPATQSTPTAPAVSPTPTQQAAPTAPLPTSAEIRAEVNASIQIWAKALNSKDIKGYLSSYTPDYTTDGLSHDAWANQSRDRIKQSKSITMQAVLQNLEVRPTEVIATIRQNDRPGGLKSNTKTLFMIKAGDRWLIKQERKN